jgi:hypothetical protein
MTGIGSRFHTQKAKLAALAAVAAALIAAPAASAQPPVRGPVNYASPAAWLCLPGRADACAVDQSAIIVQGNGRTRLEEFELPRREPQIDCFYVYPTVSIDSGYYSDMAPDAEERRVVASQFARFSQVCRTFAPIYRQTTLTALRRMMDGEQVTLPPGEAGGYSDVLNAFRSYIANNNQGRGFVLIGHSQGAMHLKRLIAEEIDGRGLQGYLVSAILLGTDVQVPPGGVVGGDFRSIPLCQRDADTGCVISYASFRENIPPAADSLFGQGRAGTVAACTNPANLSRGRGEPDAYLPAYGDLGGASAPAPLWTGDPWEPVGTPFVKVPGLIETECVTNARGSYLAVRIDADPRDARTDVINGDVLDDAGRPSAQWGLHLIDVNLSMGDLIDIVERQGRSWRAPRR